MIIALIHGIMTRQTDASWPDYCDAWFAQSAPDVRIIKRRYFAGPFPRWNNWVKDPRIAKGLAEEIELLKNATPLSPIWIIAHSNGAVIALRTLQALISRGIQVGGVILTGAAVEADLAKNMILRMQDAKMLGGAISYSSQDDEVVAGDARATTNFWFKLRDFFWGRLMWPYGCLGRTGWLYQGKPIDAIFRQYNPLTWTRWYRGGHSCYFDPERRNCTFGQMWSDIRRVEAWRGLKAEG